jgi:hypothetical protein
MSNVGFIYLVSVTTMMALSFKTYLRIDGRISSGYLQDNRNTIADPSLINRYPTDTSLRMASIYGNIMQGELTKVRSCDEIPLSHICASLLRLENLLIDIYVV